MSVHAMAWAMSQQLVSDRTARHVLLVLADSADQGGCNAFPAIETLAQQTGLTDRTVREKLDDLEKLGAIRQGDRALIGWLLMKGATMPICYDLVIEDASTAAFAPGATLATAQPGEVSP